MLVVGAGQVLELYELVILGGIKPYTLRWRKPSVLDAGSEQVAQAYMAHMDVAVLILK